MMRLRRQIGVDPHRFAPIPPQPRARHLDSFHYPAHQRQEAGLAGHLHGVNADLERRIQRRKP